MRLHTNLTYEDLVKISPKKGDYYYSKTKQKNMIFYGAKFRSEDGAVIKKANVTAVNFITPPDFLYIASSLIHQSDPRGASCTIGSTTCPINRFNIYNNSLPYSKDFECYALIDFSNSDLNAENYAKKLEKKVIRTDGDKSKREWFFITKLEAIDLAERLYNEISL